MIPHILGVILGVAALILAFLGGAWLLGLAAGVAVLAFRWVTGL